MVALRVTFRLGWQIANPINFDQAVEANRYPVRPPRPDVARLTCGSSSPP
jgi:hypothetical protein